MLHVVSQVDGHRFIIPLVPRGLVESQVIPEIESRTRLEVRAGVNMIASRAARDFAV